jgi:hypothetical protein
VLTRISPFQESEGNKSTEKRDFLRAIEIEVQRQWKENKTFELDAPADVSKPKYMATFPYPYMNGSLNRIICIVCIFLMRAHGSCGFVK